MTLSSLLLPVKSKEIRGMVQNLFGQTVSSKWTQRFLERHKARLRLRSAKSMAKGRLEDFDMDDMHRWTSMVREEFKRNRPQSHQLLNFDEIALWCDRSSEKRVFMTSNRQPNIRATHHLLSVKVLAFVVANGTRFLTVMIVKEKDSKKDVFIEPEQATPAIDMCYFRCRGGNLTQHSFGLIKDRFIGEWRPDASGSAGSILSLPCDRKWGSSRQGKILIHCEQR
jgi:hypothetical protein